MSFTQPESAWVRAYFSATCEALFQGTRSSGAEVKDKNDQCQCSDCIRKFQKRVNESANHLSLSNYQENPSSGPLSLISARFIFKLVTLQRGPLMGVFDESLSAANL